MNSDERITRLRFLANDLNYPVSTTAAAYLAPRNKRVPRDISSDNCLPYLASTATMIAMRSGASSLWIIYAAAKVGTPAVVKHTEMMCTWKGKKVPCAHHVMHKSHAAAKVQVAAKKK